jgi:uncharacterized protein (TIGR00369 family)
VLSEAVDPSLRSHWQRMEAEYPDSPIHATFGFGLHVVGEGTVEVAYHGAVAGLNRHHVVAGGTLASMLDSAIVQACRSQLSPDARLATIEMKVNFVRALRSDCPVKATGVVDHMGKSTAVGSARVLDDSGTLYALGIATVAVRRGD